MSYGPTAIERAFTLATSGGARSLSQIKKSLRVEGYSEGYIYGSSIAQQLMKLIAAAKAKPKRAKARHD